MEKKTTSGIVLVLLTIMITFATNIQPVKASETIYIMADGSVNPSNAPIQRDEDIYTFTADIYDSIVVEKDNIIVDGNGYTLQGTGTGNGFQLFGRTNVTIRNVRIIQFYTGVSLVFSIGSTITENTLTSNSQGINLYQSPGNNVSTNTVTGQVGIAVYQDSDYNTIERNTIESNTDISIGILFGMANWCNVVGNSLTNYYVGIMLDHSFNNTFLGNVIKNSFLAMRLNDSHENAFYHNNFIDNTNQIFFIEENFNNVWDNGYPSGGNYWSDYSIDYPAVGDDYQGESQEVLGSDGIWDHPYEIDASNLDNYPLIEPWTPVERKVGVKVGDWVKYGNFDVSWSSNDPAATMPIGLSILREVEWWENSVEDILDTKIRYQQLLHFKDGSEYTTTVWIDVDTGSGTPLSFVSFGLVPDDCIYASAPWYAWKINETISHKYAGVNRETNHLDVTTSMQFGPPPVYPNTTGNFYWDRETGVLCELSMKHLNQTGSYMTSWSVFYEIVDTSLWEAPTPPTIMASLDIDPDTLDLRSKGKWITAYIQLPEGYNPENFDASTILLNETIQPVLDPKYGFVTNSSEYLVDHNNDGILERMVKFDRATLQSWIYQSAGMRSDVPLTLTGKLLDGTQFEGTDTISVFWTGRRAPFKR